MEGSYETGREYQTHGRRAVCFRRAEPSERVSDLRGAGDCAASSVHPAASGADAPAAGNAAGSVWPQLALLPARGSRASARKTGPGQLRGAGGRSGRRIMRARCFVWHGGLRSAPSDDVQLDGRPGRPVCTAVRQRLVLWRLCCSRVRGCFLDHPGKFGWPYPRTRPESSGRGICLPVPAACGAVQCARKACAASVL